MHVSSAVQQAHLPGCLPAWRSACLLTLTESLPRSLLPDRAGLCCRLAAEQVSLSQLLAALSAAQACCMDATAAACLEAAADKLAASGGRWPAGQAAELAAFDPATLAQLLQLLSVRAVGSVYRSPNVFDVRPDCSAAQEGGFTWSIQGFSRLRGVEEPGLLSPWVEVGGFQWRLQVRRSGSGARTAPMRACTLHACRVTAASEAALV